jgi:cytochrome c-type biogenesis protein CcmH
MISFWILALLMCAIAAAFILLPLYLNRRARASAKDRTRVNVDIYEERLAELQASLSAGEIDEPEFELMKAELQNTLLNDTVEEEPATPVAAGVGRLPIVVAILVPAFALFAYSGVGLSWGAIDDVELARQFNKDDAHGHGSMDADVARLAKQMQKEPGNDQGWFLLAQSYMNLELYSKAAESFQHLIDRYPGDYNLASYYTQAIYMADERTVTPRVDEAINRTLKLNPHDISVLEIRAMDAYSKGNYGSSIKFFRQALVGKPDKQRAKMINDAIAGVEKQMRKEGLKVPEEAPASTPPSPAMETGQPTVAQATNTNPKGTAHRSLRVLVEVGDDVQAPSDASVFVFAKAMNGPPMPLAVQRMSRTELPKLVKLDDTMGMIQGMSLANFNDVEVVARISSSGIANASPDDYEARSGAIDLTRPQSVITLKIEHKRKDQ